MCFSAPQKSTFVSQGQEVASPLMITSNVDQLLEIFFCFFRLLPQRQPDHCIETEMWKHSDSEVDLSPGREEESDRKSLGDITLGTNPEFRMTLE